MYRRKIQLVAGTTYSVSLPKEWVKKNNFREKDELLIYEGKDRTLIISPHSVNESRPNDVSINVDEYSNIIIGVVYALFYQGFENITLFSKTELSNKNRTKVRRAIAKLSGVEITYEDEKKITMKVLIDFSKLSITQLLFRVGLILESSFSALEKPSDLGEIELNENELDRLYSLSIKIILLSLSDSNVLMTSNIKDVSFIPSYFLISKKIENIGDNVYGLYEYIHKTGYPLDKNAEITRFFSKEIKRSLDPVLRGFPKIFEKPDKETIKKIDDRILAIEDKTVLNYLRDTLRFLMDVEEEITTLSFYTELKKKKQDFFIN